MKISMNASERRATVALGSIFALRMLGLFMIVPVFSIYGKNYTHATPALIGLAIGIYGLAQAIMQIPFSLMADRFKRKPLIVFGLLLFALGGLVSAYSTDIWGVILGRGIAGMGAVSAVCMALLSDVVREEQRSYAMATMGMTIAGSFIIAFSLAPVLTHAIGISGLFGFTAFSAVMAIFLLLLVPNPTRILKVTQKSFKAQLSTVLKMPDLNRLHYSIFMIHLIMTASFVMFPRLLVSVAGIDVSHHGYVYLPMLLLGFVLAVPMIIVAEAKRRMRRIFISAVIAIVISMVMIMFGVHQKWLLLMGMGLFMIAFNCIEALLPSWVSKVAPVAEKATAMGLNASSQFLGAGLGGVFGGLLLTYCTPTVAWLILTVMACVWLLVTLGLKSPPYLSSISIRLPDEPLADWSTEILSLDGVEDLVVLNEDHVAYLKIDKRKVNEHTRQELSRIAGVPLVI